MNAFTIKIIAVVTMLIDHTGAMLYYDAYIHTHHELLDGLLWLRVIGRIAFPLFAFQVAEGCAHTRDHIKYIFRLAVFTLLAEIPFDLFDMLQGHRGVTALFTPDSQSVMVTLTLGALAIYFYKRGLQDKPDAAFWGFAAAATIPASIILQGNYQPFGVPVVLLPYIFRPKETTDLDCRIAGSRLLQAAACLAPLMAQYAIGTFGLRSGGALMAALPILLYNGKPGPKRFKYLFYVFYPAHLLILCGALYFVRNGFSFFRF